MSRYGSRIAALARRAERERAAFDGLEVDSNGDPIPEGPTSPDDAAGYLRAGAGQAVWLYVEARTGGRLVPFSAAELAALETAMNRWLECYTRCHGVALEAEFTIREAAELLLETRNIVDTAQLLTGVPDRHARPRPAR